MCDGAPTVHEFPSILLGDDMNSQKPGISISNVF